MLSKWATSAQKPIVLPPTCLALEGPSDAQLLHHARLLGKSTVFNLLTRFYEPMRGAVRIDGHDLRDVMQDSLRASMGVVFQDSILFNGSVMDNIRMGKPDATDEEIVRATRAAQVHEMLGHATNTMTRRYLGWARQSEAAKQMPRFSPI